MDFDNIGPIALFIAYMAISAWAKQKKAAKRASPGEPMKSTPSESKASSGLQLGGILEQLKKELFQEPEPPIFYAEQTEPTPEMELKPKKLEPEPIHFRGLEGNPVRKEQAQAIRVTDVMEEGQSLDEVLKPFSQIEQGILLHEILGKPRAFQKNDEWFHKS